MCLVVGFVLLFVKSSYADKSDLKACAASLRVSGKLLPYEASVADQIKASIARAQPEDFDNLGSNALVMARVMDKISKNLAVRVEASQLRGSQRIDFMTKAVDQASSALFQVAEGYLSRNESNLLDQDQLVEKITRYTLRKLKPSPNELELKSQVFQEFRTRYIDQEQSLEIIDRVAPILIKKIRIRSKELFRSATSQTEGAERALERALGFVADAIESGRQDPNTILRAVYSRMSDADYRQPKPLSLSSADLETKIKEALASSSFSPRFNELLADRVLTALRAIQRNSATPIEDDSLFSDIFELEREKILKEATDIYLKAKDAIRWNVDTQKSVYEKIESPLFVRAGRIKDQDSDFESFDQSRELINWAKKMVEARLDLLGVKVRPTLQTYLNVLQNEASREALTFDSKDTKRLLDLLNKVLLETLADMPLEVVSVMGSQRTLKEAVLSSALRPHLELEIALAAASQSEPKTRNSRKQILIRKLRSLIVNPFEPSNEKRSELLGSFISFGVTQLEDSNLDPKVVNALAGQLSGRMKIYFSPAIKLQTEALESFASLYEDFPIEYAATINQLTSSESSVVHVAYQRLRNSLQRKELLPELNEKLKSILANEMRILLFKKFLKAELPRNPQEAEAWAEEIKRQILDEINPKIAELVEAAESEAEQKRPATTEIAKAPAPKTEEPSQVADSGAELERLIGVLRSKVIKQRPAHSDGKKFRDEFDAYLKSIPAHTSLTGAEEQILAYEQIRLENKIISALSATGVQTPATDASRLHVSNFIHKTMTSNTLDQRIPAEAIADFKKYAELDDLIAGNNLSLVVKLAKSKVRTGVALGDLVQLGNQGLIKAVRSFDPSLGYKFSTYATRVILTEMNRYAVTDGSVFKTDGDNLKAVRDAINELQLAGNLNPSPLEISAHAKIKLNLVVSALNRMQTPQALDQSINPEGGKDTSLSSMLPSQRENAPSHGLDKRDLMARIKKSMEQLEDDRIRQVLIMRNGLDGLPIKTLEQIAEIFGVGRERIRQMEVVGRRQLQGLLLLEEDLPHPNYRELIHHYYLSSKMEPDLEKIASIMEVPEETLKVMIEDLNHRILQIGNGAF